MNFETLAAAHIACEKINEGGILGEHQSHNCQWNINS